MYRVGILGSENSHAMAFARIFNGMEGAIPYPDVRVVGIGGNDAQESEKVFVACDLEFIAQKPEDMLGKVDAVMVTARDGALHLPFARPFIEAGIPAFIDKPFCCSVKDAVELASLAKGIPLVGGSSVKGIGEVLKLQKMVQEGACGQVLGGSVSAPLNMVNPYGGFFFYASHLAEISMTIFGYDVRAVSAVRTGNCVTAIAQYDGFAVTQHYLQGVEHYAASVMGLERIVQQPISIAGCYQSECAQFVQMLRTGCMPHSYEQLIYPVVYLNAVKMAYETGIPQTLPQMDQIL